MVCTFDSGTPIYPLNRTYVYSDLYKVHHLTSSTLIDLKVINNLYVQEFEALKSKDNLTAAALELS